MTRSRIQLALGLLILLGTALACLAFFRDPGTSDDRVFLKWMQNVDRYGIQAGYQDNASDYPPFTSIIFYGVDQVAKSLDLGPFVAFKLSLYFFVLSTCIVFFAWTRDPGALAVVAVTLIVDGMVFGYVDAYFAPFLLLGLWALAENKFTLGVSLYSLACLIKWQPVIIAPFIVAYVVLQNETTLHRMWAQVDWKRLAQSVLAPVVVLVALTWFIFGAAPLLAFQYATNNPQLSAQALNANWVLTHLLHVFAPARFGALTDNRATMIRTEDWTLLIGPKLAFFTFYAVAWLAFLGGPKTFERLLTFSTLGYLAYFIFNTGVHENHLFLAAVLGACLWSLNPAGGVPFLVWAALANLNIFVFYEADGKRRLASRVIDGVDIPFPLALIVTLLFLIFIFYVIRDDVRSRRAHASKTAAAVVLA